MLIHSNRQTVIDINTNDNVQIIEPQNQSVLVCLLELHLDSLKAHKTKHMT